MTRLAIAGLLVIAACSGKGKSNQPTTATGSAPPLLVKKVSLSWGFQPVGELSDVFLATTDETGKQVSHPIGRYKGTCAAITPVKEMNAITGAACSTAGAGGTELHAIARADEIVVLQMGIVPPGATPDPMAREQVTAIKVPVGVAIEAGQ